MIEITHLCIRKLQKFMFYKISDFKISKSLNEILVELQAPRYNDKVTSPDI